MKRPSCFTVDSKVDDKLLDTYFDFSNGQLIVKKSFIPAMITKDEAIIKDDCFGYIMERYPL